MYIQCTIISKPMCTYYRFQVKARGVTLRNTSYIPILIDKELLNRCYNLNFTNNFLTGSLKVYVLSTFYSALVIKYTKLTTLLSL